MRKKILGALAEQQQGSCRDFVSCLRIRHNQALLSHEGEQHFPRQRRTTKFLAIFAQDRQSQIQIQIFERRLRRDALVEGLNIVPRSAASFRGGIAVVTFEFFLEFREKLVESVNSSEGGSWSPSAARKLPHWDEGSHRAAYTSTRR